MNFEKLKELANAINIGSDDFWEFIEKKIRRFPAQVEEFPWACFPITDKNNILVDIKLIVPNIVDEGTLLVNIHELAHAYELYGLMGQECVYQVEQSEESARTKEKEYKQLVKEKKINPSFISPQKSEKRYLY